MGLFKKYVNQTRKPEGFLGKMMVNGMNGGHAKMADWGLAHLTTIIPEEMLEVGCGGGRNASELLKKYPFANMTAIDYSQVSVDKATEYNREAIAGGRFIINQSHGSRFWRGNEPIQQSKVSKTEEVDADIKAA